MAGSIPDDGLEPLRACVLFLKKNMLLLVLERGNEIGRERGREEKERGRERD